MTGFLPTSASTTPCATAPTGAFAWLCPVDACTTDSEVRHQQALAAFRGYCRQASTAALLAELEVAT